MPREDDGAAVTAAIARAQADVLASNVAPRADVARMVGAAPDEAGPGQRAVVWSAAARDVFIALVERLAAHDPATAKVAAGAIDRTAAELGRVATGVAGPLPFTYEKVAAYTPYVLAFELVTWTKAGEVIAILHLFEAARDASAEAPLWP